MGWMKQIHTETQELYDAAVSAMNENDSHEDAFDEFSEVVQEMGWKSPTEVKALVRNAREEVKAS